MKEIADQYFFTENKSYVQIGRYERGLKSWIVIDDGQSATAMDVILLLRLNTYSFHVRSKLTVVVLFVQTVLKGTECLVSFKNERQEKISPARLLITMFRDNFL